MFVSPSVTFLSYLSALQFSRCLEICVTPSMSFYPFVLQFCHVYMYFSLFLLPPPPPHLFLPVFLYLFFVLLLCIYVFLQSLCTVLFICRSAFLFVSFSSSVHLFQAFPCLLFCFFLVSSIWVSIGFICVLCETVVFVVHLSVSLLLVDIRSYRHMDTHAHGLFRRDVMHVYKYIHMYVWMHGLKHTYHI